MIARIAEELKIIRRLIIVFVSVFLLLFGTVLFFAPQRIVLAGHSFWFLVPDSPTLATQAFLSAKDFLVPANVPVVALSPMASFTASITMALLLSVLAAFPLGLFLAGRFFWPALQRHERRGLMRFILPAFILFYGGCAFGYFVIIPKTFALLYAFATPLDVVPFFSLDDMVTSVFLLTLAVGCVFLLPVIMPALASIGLVERDFWWRHFRGAVVSMIIFSAVVTPDGSGVTALLLSGPLIGLYLFGALSVPFLGRRDI